MTRQVRRIAITCALISICWAIFWLTQPLWGIVTGTFGALATGVYFVLVAAGFSRGAQGKKIPVPSWWPFLALSGVWAWKAEAHHQNGPAAVATFATVVVCILVGTGLERKQRGKLEGKSAD
jgi:hypothetical protein